MEKQLNRLPMGPAVLVHELMLTKNQQNQNLKQKEFLKHKHAGESARGRGAENPGRGLLSLEEISLLLRAILADRFGHLGWWWGGVGGPNSGPRWRQQDVDEQQEHRCKLHLRKNHLVCFRSSSENRVYWSWSLVFK